ncbi:MAG: hypothetical protein ACK559_14080, partial [bacterium]
MLVPERVAAGRLASGIRRGVPCGLVRGLRTGVSGRAGRKSASPPAAAEPVARLAGRGVGGARCKRRDGRR